jgi:hypothetical protein
MLKRHKIYDSENWCSDHKAIVTELSLISTKKISEEIFINQIITKKRNNDAPPKIFAEINNNILCIMIENSYCCKYDYI